jgi:sortase (surface protein transpeptidase)
MIPALDVDSELVTVPLNGNTWSVEWLGSQSGILEGSALPGRGLSLIAAHNSLNEAESGPFALVSLLEPNDVIAVKGKRNDLKIFRVFANELLASDDMKRVNAVAGREANTLVLITCENESAEGGYLNRRVIFAKPAE